jgi:hypothetical protein
LLAILAACWRIASKLAPTTLMTSLRAAALPGEGLLVALIYQHNASRPRPLPPESETCGSGLGREITLTPLTRIPSPLGGAVLPEALQGGGDELVAMAQHVEAPRQWRQQAIERL